MAAVAVFLVLGTERGTRWAFAQIQALAPIEISSSVTGTLLTQVDVPFIRYVDADRNMRLSDISLNIDWSASTFSSIAVDQLVANAVKYRSEPDADKEPAPLKIEVPNLPIGIAVSDLRLASLQFNDVLVSAISVHNFAAEGRTVDVESASATVEQLTVTLDAVHVELERNVPISANVQWSLADSTFSGAGSLTGSIEQIQVLHKLNGEYRVASSGSVELLNRTEPAFSLVNEFEELPYQEWAARNGSVQVSGTVQQFTVSLASALAHEGHKIATMEGQASGNIHGLDDLDLTVNTDLASVRALGSVFWAPALSLDLLLTSDGIDPSDFFEVPAGRLDSRLRVKAAGPEEFSVDILSLKGTWNGQSSDVKGRLLRGESSWQCIDCRIHVGTNHVNVDGSLTGRALNGRVDISAPAMEQLWSGLSGDLEAVGNVGGTLILPMLSGKAIGSNLVFGDWSVGGASVRSSEATAENLDVAVEIVDLANGESTLGSGRFKLDGDRENMQLSASWRLDEYSADTDVSVRIIDDLATGTVNSASISEPLSGAWSLDHPVTFTLGPDIQKLAAASWSNGQTVLRHEEILLQGQDITMEATLSDAPLETFNLLLPDIARVQGYVDARVDLRHTIEGWSGNVDWRQRDTELRIISSSDDVYVGRIPEARASAVLVNSRATVQAVVHTEQGSNVVLDAVLSELSQDADLRARLQLNGDHWDWIPRLVPEIDDFSGEIVADIQASGALASPDLQGELNWTSGALAVPGLNLPLSDIDVTLTGSSAGDMAVSGDARSGEGTLQVVGKLDDVTTATPEFHVKLLGDRATLLNWEEALLVASPDLEFVGDLSGVHVTGRVELDKAEVSVRELPEGAVEPSADVVVDGRASEERRKTRVTGEVDVLLSEHIHIDAFGLDTNVEGQLRFIVPQDREPQGVGELRLVGGVFESYGQKLEIESGTMVFTGPLDDPIINVRAVRRIERSNETVLAGIELKGRASNLTSTLFSDPAMSQADALSYIVLGRPLEEATTSDGTNLSDSAYSLGLKQAALITNQIGQTVGLDELRVDGSNQNTTELIAGKQINSRLYARYAYGVFSKLGTLLMRYKLTDSISIEIGAGEHQSMDILYTIERE